MNGRAKLQFLTWLRKTYPELYETAVAEASSGQLGAEDETSGNGFWSKLVTGIAAAGTTYLTLKNQRDAMKLNLERAQQGLPPIDPGITAPVIRTEIDLPPDVVSKITQEAGMNVNKILMFAAVGLGAYFLMNR